jgi:hypothetical protein
VSQLEPEAVKFYNIWLPKKRMKIARAKVKTQERRPQKTRVIKRMRESRPARSPITFCQSYKQASINSS